MTKPIKKVTPSRSDKHGNRLTIFERLIALAAREGAHFRVEMDCQSIKAYWAPNPRAREWGRMWPAKLLHKSWNQLTGRQWHELRPTRRERVALSALEQLLSDLEPSARAAALELAASIDQYRRRGKE